jgi:hypothetical protein
MNMLTHPQALTHAEEHGNAMVEYRANSAEPWATCSPICAWNPAPFEYRIKTVAKKIVKWCNVPRGTLLKFGGKDTFEFLDVSPLDNIHRVWVLHNFSTYFLHKSELQLSEEQPILVITDEVDPFQLYKAGFKGISNGYTYRIIGLRDGWEMEK